MQSCKSCQTLSPHRCTICGDYALAALESFGDDKAEVVRKGRENEHVAPLPHFLLLFAKGIGHNFQLWGNRKRGMGNRRDLPYSFFKELQPLEWMLATEIEKVEVFFDMINGIYRIKIEESFNIRYNNRRTMLAEIGLNPPLLGFAGGNNHLGAAEAETLDWTSEALLPAVIL